VVWKVWRCLADFGKVYSWFGRRSAGTHKKKGVRKVAEITGVDGRPMLNIDRSKVTASKLKCLESESVQALLEAWLAGEVETGDVQTWLTFQMTIQLMALGVSHVIVPTVGH